MMACVTYLRGKWLWRCILICAYAGTMTGGAFAAARLEIQNGPTLKLTGEAGTTNQIQFLSEIGGSNAWKVLTNIVLTHSPQYFNDSTAAGIEKRFYQAVVTGGTITNAPPDMAFIPSGTFTMGDNVDRYQLPVHDVYVSAFYMDKCEVTKQRWDEVYSWAVAHGYSFDRAGSGSGTNHPVHTINWYDAVKWCNARSEREGRAPAYYTSDSLQTVYRSGRVDVQNDWVKWSGGYRLPTEAEWEYAARGGLSGKRFPWGDTISHSQANYFSDISFSYDISPTRGYHPDYQIGWEAYTSAVGSFEAGGFGLRDMAGNVGEWCWDYWNELYSSEIQSDPRGPASGSLRVGRGGSWMDYAAFCRVPDRVPHWPENALITCGFRCALPTGR